VNPQVCQREFANFSLPSEGCLKAVIKGVFSRSCYGNLLYHENDNNVFTNDWAVFRYHDCSIIR